MWKSYLKIQLIILLFVFIFSYRPVEASSFGSKVVSFMERTISTVLRRASDIVHYLIMQKKYTFDDYEDPNQYISPDIPEGFDAVVALTPPASTTPEEEKAITSNKPIKVTTTTVPAIKITNPPAVYVPPTPVVVPVAIPVTVIKDTTVNKNETELEPVVSFGMAGEILKYTNKERVSQSLRSLSLNEKLNKVATKKVNDLFSKEYFEHISPVGEGASDLASDIGYEYLIIGENLAMGSFDSGQEIVEAWMDSPGHRANILNSKYTEIGIAVRVDDYKGVSTLMAVQIFAKPLASCGKPDKELIESSSDTIKQMQSQAQLMFNNLTEMKTKPNIDWSYYNQKVSEYNYYAKQVNDSILALKNLIDLYNADVAEYNMCIKQ
jgi:uncharacterized protein YkwD